MQVRCQKCRFKFDATAPDDGSTIEVVCPRCGERQAVHGEAVAQPAQPAVAHPIQPVVEQPVQATAPEATVPQPPANQPQPEQPGQQQSPQPVIIYQESKSNSLPIFIIAGVALALIVLGGLWMIGRNSKVEYTANNEAIVEAVDTTETLAAVEEVVTDTTTFDDFEDDETPTNEEFTPRYTSAGYEEFGQLPFVIERQLQQSGFNIAQFAEVKSLGTIRGQMILYEHSDGVRYQFFFDESVSSSSALLTGIAISRMSHDPSGDCYHMDYLLDNADYDDRGNIYYNSSTGMYFSPGYKNGRVYCYIYTSYAPSKDPAPRG